MILEYHRPLSVDEALSLLSRTNPPTVPLGGGTVLNRRGQPGQIAVVDLQNLGLNRVERLGNQLAVGATVTLAALTQLVDVPTALTQAVRQETNWNLAQVATVAGTLVAATGRSPLATVLLAMDARLVWMPGEVETALGDFLPVRGVGAQSGLMIVRVHLPLQVRVAYASVARTPADLPIVCASVARWPSGRTRLAVGGTGLAPVLAMDGPESEGIAAAATQAMAGAEDHWASAEYRQEMAAVLARRCFAEVEAV